MPLIYAMRIPSCLYLNNSRHEKKVEIYYTIQFLSKRHKQTSTYRRDKLNRKNLYQEKKSELWGKYNGFLQILISYMIKISLSLAIFTTAVHTNFISCHSVMLGLQGNTRLIKAALVSQPLIRTMTVCTKTSKQPHSKLSILWHKLLLE